ncbi:FAD-dependent oxidoreductase [Streptomyces sp. TRM 70361]|uniref:FAD-dependent oxidoreductase n=1 Tax=Streptomyces sp. TRM 70361 TaxID=3116553 RepID=UPI003FCD2DE8
MTRNAQVNRGGRYDVVVVGAGPAGSSAALVLGRARRSVLVIDDGWPRDAPAAHMHGFLSRAGAPPGELQEAGTLRGGRLRRHRAGGPGAVRGARPRRCRAGIRARQHRRLLGDRGGVRPRRDRVRPPRPARTRRPGQRTGTPR